QDPPAVSLHRHSNRDSDDEAWKDCRRADYQILYRLKLGLNQYGPAISGLDSSGSAVTGGGSAAEESKAEQTAFEIKLEKFDTAAKIKIIKEVQTFTDLGLKEAKDLLEKVPVVLKKGVTKEEGNRIIEKLKELGATKNLAPDEDLYADKSIGLTSVDEAFHSEEFLQMYMKRKNPQKMTEKLEIRKYDPRVRRHVLFIEAKIK
ncbi:hypothetical protein IFM89_028044, partial [Coptis chinensis]